MNGLSLCIGTIIDRRMNNIVSLGLYALRCVDIKRKRYAYLVVRKPAVPTSVHNGFLRTF